MAVRSDTVPVLGIPTKILTIGECLSGKPQELILIIPGNPGLGGYYKEFMQSLYQNLAERTSIWCISHAGHYSTPDLIALKGNEHRFDLNGQILHKLAFIREHVPPHCKITFVGHSIGCKIIMDLMNHLDSGNNGNNSKCSTLAAVPNFNSSSREVQQSYFLFPTISWMRVSPAGKRVWILVAYLAAIVSFLAFLLDLLPSQLKRTIVSVLRYGDSPCCKETTVDLIKGNVIRNVLHMAHMELLQVTEPDIETLTRFADRIRFYNSASDPWCPLSYVDELKQNVPGIQVEVSDSGIPHAFVLNRANDVAGIVAKWYLSN